MGHAGEITALLTDLYERQLPLRVRAWDGSEAGPPGAVTVVLRSPEALRYILWSPNELGVARAYVSGDLDVDGDLLDGLSAVLRVTYGRRPAINMRTVANATRLARRLGAIGGRPPVPSSEARVHGRLHSRSRDAQVIRHHYDLSNDFYRLILDPTMSYSCGYWTSDDPGYGVEDAQRDKLDLICRKLELRPGARLLDVGCGWGALTVHAASRFGASVTAVTVSGQQAEFVAARLAAEGVSHLVELRRCDYREVLAEASGAYDAVAAIEMGEHVGESMYHAFAKGLLASLREQGRLLLQAMSRGSRSPGGGAFIERYIAPDMTMRPVGATLSLLAEAGFEIRDVHALREHYGRTIRAWYAKLEERWEEAVSLIGEERARVWRLYLAGGALSFEEGRMGVDQILAVRSNARGRSGMEPTRIGWDQGVAGPQGANRRLPAA